MVWRGVIIEESLDDKSLLNMIKIVKSKKTTLEKESERGFLTFLHIELDDKKKDEFVKRAVASIKDRFYLHICKGEKMIVIFKDKIFKFSSDETDEIKRARNYGLSIGILREQMSFEELIKDPYG